MSAPAHRHHEHAADPHDHHLADLLELDVEVLHDHWHAVLDQVRAAAGPGARRVVDLGAGTGAGALGLAGVFPDAQVVAVDADDAMLARLRSRLAALAPAARVQTVVADLDAPWPQLEAADVVWASSALHHLSDPDAGLARVHDVLRPGGVVAVVEFAEPLRVLPDDLGVGRPGLESRCLQALSGERADTLPHLGSDWPDRLRRAGFVDVRDHPHDVDEPATSAPARRYVRLWLERLRGAAREHLAADDVDVLDSLLDGGGLERRDDLRLHGTRTLTLGRRAAEGTAATG